MSKTGDTPKAAIEVTDDQLDAVVGGEKKSIANETYVNRLKTSDKQQKAVLDFIKG